MIDKISFYLRIALKNLVVHKARMTLALLGILFAVMSLVAFGNISNGMKKKVEMEIGKFGKNLVIVRAGLVFAAGRSTRQFTESRTLKLRDAQLIKESIPGVSEVVPYFDVSYAARYKENSLTVTVTGVPNKIFDIRSIDLAAGRFFTGAEEEKAEKKAVIGFKVYDNFFRGGSDRQVYTYIPGSYRSCGGHAGKRDRFRRAGPGPAGIYASQRLYAALQQC